MKSCCFACLDCLACFACLASALCAAIHLLGSGSVCFAGGTSIRGKTSGGPGLVCVAGGGGCTVAAGFGAELSGAEFFSAGPAGALGGTTGISKANSGGAGAGAEAGGGIFSEALVTASQRRPASIARTSAEPNKIQNTVGPAVDLRGGAESGAAATGVGRNAWAAATAGATIGGGNVAAADGV